MRLGQARSGVCCAVFRGRVYPSRFERVGSKVGHKELDVWKAPRIQEDAISRHLNKLTSYSLGESCFHFDPIAACLCIAVAGEAGFCSEGGAQTAVDNGPLSAALCCSSRHPSVPAVESCGLMARQPCDTGNRDTPRQLGPWYFRVDGHATVTQGSARDGLPTTHTVSGLSALSCVWRDAGNFANGRGGQRSPECGCVSGDAVGTSEIPNQRVSADREHPQASWRTTERSRNAGAWRPGLSASADIFALLSGSIDAVHATAGTPRLPFRQVPRTWWAPIRESHRIQAPPPPSTGRIAGPLTRSYP